MILLIDISCEINSDLPLEEDSFSLTSLLLARTIQWKYRDDFSGQAKKQRSALMTRCLESHS